MHNDAVLLTGATGLLGRELVGLLASAFPKKSIVATYFSHSPVLHKPNLTWVRCDLANIRTNPFAGFVFNKVVHAAAFLPPAGTDPDDFAEKIFFTNLLGTIDLFNRIKLGSQAHIVFISSAAVYSQKHGKFKETDDTYSPHIGGIYAQTKSYCEWFLRNRFGRLTIVRPSYIYGRGMDKNQLLPRLLRQAMLGKELLLRPPYNMQCDYIHSRDVAAGVTSVLKRQKLGTYNLGSGYGTSIKKLAEECIKVAKNGRLPGDLIRAQNKPSFCNRQLVDITKAKKQLGWRPGFDLGRGLKDLSLWLKEEGLNER